MALDSRIGSKVSKQLRREEAPATRLEPYPYVGIVKNNLDATRSGRLEVFIPDLGGSPSDSSHWIPVQYASPFMGSTVQKTTGQQNEFDTVSHSYGMWMIPPDLEVEVLVIFVAGDLMRGYWISCINSNLSKHMIPAIAGSTDVTTSGGEYKGPQVPVAEFNEHDPKNYNSGSFHRNKKPIHEYQANILKKQGLDRDNVRGSITSSAQRESPSNVFGISTPGRPYKNDAAEDETAFIKAVKNKTLTTDQIKYSARKGGHTFVMDDGSITGHDQLFRLRSSGGHQILMHDTQQVLYISHASGDSWMEFTNDGKINVYSKSDISFRSGANLNFHADNNINLHAGGKLNIKSIGSTMHEAASYSVKTQNSTISIDASGAIGIKGASTVAVDSGNNFIVKASKAKIDCQTDINSGGGKTLTLPKDIKINRLNDTTGSGLAYYITPSALSTICSVAPTHEPYIRIAIEEETIPAESNTPPIGTAYKTSKNSKPIAAISDKAIRSHPTATTAVGKLTVEQTTALGLAIANAESATVTPSDAVCNQPAGLQLQNDKTGYEARNQCGHLGKYMLGPDALITAGLVKSHVTSADQLSNPNSWKDGLTMEKFLASSEVQEQAFLASTQSNYDKLVSSKTITAQSTPEEIGGLLMTAHSAGSDGATAYAKTGEGTDNTGTEGSLNFKSGSQAIAQADRVAEVKEDIPPVEATTPTAAPQVNPNADKIKALEIEKNRAATDLDYATIHYEGQKNMNANYAKNYANAIAAQEKSASAGDTSKVEYWASEAAVWQKAIQTGDASLAKLEPGYTAKKAAYDSLVAQIAALQ